MKNLNQVDPAIATLLGQERERCDNEINLIASENYADKAVLQAVGSVLTNKYAEGYPGKRYYGGCHIIDQVELIAIERCKQLFGAQHTNVQPHAGSQANMAVYFATLNPGDTLLGMGLDQGGHLTHGHPINFSGRLYNCVSYGVNRQTERLDYDHIAQLAHTHKPKLIIAGGSAYSRVIDFEKFSQIAQQVNALLLVDMAHIAGLVAAGLHPNPVPWADFVSSTTHKTLRGPRGGMVLCKQQYAAQLDKAVMPGMQGGPFMQVIAAKAVSFAQALTPEFRLYQQQVIANAQVLAKTLQELGYRIVTDGTDNHLFVVDLRSQQCNGRQAEQALAQASIYVNRNTIPFDLEKPLLASGIRLGTPALTTRGMKEPEMIAIAHFIDQALRNRDSQQRLAAIKQEVAQLSVRFYFYKQDLVHGFID